MKRIIAVAMLLSVLFSVSACNKETKQASPEQPVLEGEWYTYLEMSDMVNEMVQMQTGAPTVTVAFPVQLDLSLLQDGTFSLSVNEEQLKTQIDALGDVLWQIVVDQAAAQSHMTTVQATEALTAQGKSKEVLLQQLDLSSMFKNTISTGGVWKRESDKLYFAQNAEELTDADGYSFILDNDQFTLSFAQEALAADQEPAQRQITFERAK